ncbi:MAG: 1 4-dihydroxy-2-naphthoate octaprenyltransferase [Chloroflexi bacterium]|nr:MAG: 1 4-dihydroxy-2-naphthoate octaprenyltransferase [Chloroflexota bacterium]MBA4376469.1 prenyltransferase [Anaerolinea sp.]
MKYIIGPMRLPFLVLAPACVFLGMAAAIWAVGSINSWHAVLCFAGGVMAHISVNALNEYGDIKSGLDTKTTRTPFSGGSGVLAEDPSKAPYALATGLVSAAICAAIGVYFFILHGWPILVLGALGLFVIVTYTPWLNRQPVLCLLAPGMGFGTLMVNGTYFALTGVFSWTALLVSFIPFFLVSNLLLLNQFPDAEADKTVGRRHFPILIGKKASAVIFTAFLVGTYVAIILGVVLKLTPAWALLGLATIITAIPTAKGALQHADDLPKLMPSLGQNVLLNLLTPVLMGVGLLIG